mmetsp:Transcript_54159/g.90231  ORF Transcript_54159/g.90231 Transcript_54159/m.90231 type:complete len:212 (-) Transcript_54159:9-644(-)
MAVQPGVGPGPDGDDGGSTLPGTWAAWGQVDRSRGHGAVWGCWGLRVKDRGLLASAGWATAVGTVALSGVAVGADEDVKMPDLETAAVLGTGGGTEEELLAGVEGTASVAHLEALGEDSAVASSDWNTVQSVCTPDDAESGVPAATSVGSCIVPANSLSSACDPPGGRAGSGAAGVSFRTRLSPNRSRRLCWVGSWALAPSNGNVGEREVG